jgi:large subunit ribosomal protein L27
MAHKKAGGSTRNGRDSNPKYLGDKCGDGQSVLAGTIIVRQRGLSTRADLGVGVGRDYTLYAKIDGAVKFVKKYYRGQRRTFAKVIATS